jgi:hypothetical protein
MRDFYDIARSDPTPARPGEHSFAFLNRVDSVYWGRVRDFVERVYASYPAEHATDVRNRFRDEGWAAHAGAWFELYLHELFRVLGACLEIHPALQGTEARPDFLLDGRTIVEARHVKAGITAGTHAPGMDAWITGPLEELWHPNFMVSVRILQRDPAQPRHAAVISGVLQWLDSLDPDQPEQHTDLEKAAGGWRFLLRPIPMSAARRKDTSRRLIGIFPGGGGWDSTVNAVRSALKEKARKYGKTGMPYVIALSTTSGFLTDEHVWTALYAKEGFWASRNTRVSGVLIGDGVLPWTAAGPVPRIWLNPLAARPIPSNLRLPTASVDGRDGPDLLGSQLFGLDPEWPGPEPPFPRA